MLLRRLATFVRPQRVFSVRQFSEEVEAELPPYLTRTIEETLTNAEEDMLWHRNTMKELDEKAQQQDLPWRTQAAVMLERTPVCEPPRPQWMLDKEEVDFAEYEKRFQAYVEVYGTKYQFVPPAIPPEYRDSPLFSNFTIPPGPYQTRDDEAGQHHSLQRRLTSHLLLLVKRHRDSNAWQLPHTKARQGETLREAAERCLQRALRFPHDNHSNFVYFIANWPSVYYAYEYPDDVKAKRKQFGAKTFYFRAQWVGHQDLHDRSTYEIKKLNDGEGVLNEERPPIIRLQPKLYEDFAFVPVEKSEGGEEEEGGEKDDGLLESYISDENLVRTLRMMF
jgi:hypothetical protein